MNLMRRIGFLILFLGILSGPQVRAQSLTNADINRKLSAPDSWRKNRTQDLRNYNTLFAFLNAESLDGMVGGTLPSPLKTQVVDPLSRYQALLSQIVKDKKVLQAHIAGIAQKLEDERKRPPGSRPFTDAFITQLQSVENQLEHGKTHDRQIATQSLEDLFRSLEAESAKVEIDRSSTKSDAIFDGTLVPYTALESAPSASNLDLQNSQRIASLNFKNAPVYGSNSVGLNLTSSLEGRAPSSLTQKSAAEELGLQASANGRDTNPDELYLREPSPGKPSGILPSGDQSIATSSAAMLNTVKNAGDNVVESLSPPIPFAKTPVLPAGDSSSNPTATVPVPVVAEGSGSSSSHTNTDGEKEISVPLKVAEHSAGSDKPSSPGGSADHAVEGSDPASPEHPIARTGYDHPIGPPVPTKTEPAPAAESIALNSAPASPLSPDSVAFVDPAAMRLPGDDLFPVDTSDEYQATTPVPGLSCEDKFKAQMAKILEGPQAQGIGPWYRQQFQHSESLAAPLKQAWSWLEKKPETAGYCDRDFADAEAQFSLIDAFTTATETQVRGQHNVAVVAGCPDLDHAGRATTAAYKSVIDLYGRLLTSAAMLQEENARGKNPARNLPVVVNARILPAKLGAEPMKMSFAESLANCKNGGLAKILWAHEADLRLKVNRSVLTAQTCAPSFELRLMSDEASQLDSQLGEYSRLLQKHSGLGNSNKEAEALAKDFTTFPKESNSTHSTFEKAVLGGAGSEASNKFFTAYAPDQIYKQQNTENCSESDRFLRWQHSALIQFASSAGSGLLSARKSDTLPENQTARGKH
jgi:hypothetical protein